MLPFVCLFLFCTAFLRVGEKKDFTLYQGYCQSVVDVLGGESFRAIGGFSEIRLNLSFVHGCLSDCHEGSMFNLYSKNYIKIYAKPLCNPFGDDFKKHDLIGMQEVIYTFENASAVVFLYHYFFIHERETLATKIRPSMSHKPICFQCALEIFQNYVFLCDLYLI